MSQKCSIRVSKCKGQGLGYWLGYWLGLGLGLGYFFDPNRVVFQHCQGLYSWGQGQKLTWLGYYGMYYDSYTKASRIRQAALHAYGNISPQTGSKRGQRVGFWLEKEGYGQGKESIKFILHQSGTWLLYIYTSTTYCTGNKQTTFYILYWLCFYVLCNTNMSKIFLGIGIGIGIGIEIRIRI